MIEQAIDRDSLNRVVEGVRRHLAAGDLSVAAGQAAQQVGGGGEPAAKLTAALPRVTAATASSGGREDEPVPYLARDPMISLVQSSVEDTLRGSGVRDETPQHRGLWSQIVHTVEALIHPGAFAPDDPEWVIKIGESMLNRLAEGNHPFNPLGASHQISDSARLVVVGDWGTGLPRARAVAELMAQEVAGALAEGREAHVVHLGDVYYSGLPSEVERHVLAFWPVTADQARAGVTSWSLNGNHDMYSGGYGYFETLLADARFGAQRSPDGKSTSFFRLESPSWDVVGLDTSWDPVVLTPGTVGALQDPQAEFVASVAQEPGEKRLVLLSHHQLTSVYSRGDIGTELSTKLAPVLSAGRATGWWWGHEHLCMGFKASREVGFPRCVGHGGVPVLRKRTDGDPIPDPGEWEEYTYLESGGNRWARFGFAVLDLHPDHLEVRYRDDDGTQTRSEIVT